MARKTQKKKTAAKRPAAARTGRIRARVNQSARTARGPLTAEARALRERIDEAVSEGTRLRQEILDRIDAALREHRPGFRRTRR